MTLEIVGAGFGRTGTDSLREALTILGFGPCHHMYEIRDNPDRLEPWHDYFCAGAPLDLDAMFDGYRSQVAAYAVASIAHRSARERAPRPVHRCRVRRACAR